MLVMLYSYREHVSKALVNIVLLWNYHNPNTTSAGRRGGESPSCEH